MTFAKSESIKELAIALCKAQMEIDHPKKNKVNPHFRNEYADLGSVIEATRPFLLKHGLVLLQPPCGDGIANMLLHESGEWLFFQATMPDKPQEYGSATTYLRRYSGQGMTNTNAEVDDDAEAAHGRAVPERKKDIIDEIPIIKDFANAIAEAHDMEVLKAVGEQIRDAGLSASGRGGLHELYAAKKEDLAPSKKRKS